MTDIFQKIAEEQMGHEPAALCIVVGTHGSTPRDTGAKMLVYPDGGIYGTIGGGNLEKAVIDEALDALKEGHPRLVRHDLVCQHDMCCGGSMDIYIEPLMKKRKLYIFGAGHTGHALARHARELDFQVLVIDDRKEFTDAVQMDGIQTMQGAFGDVVKRLPFDGNTYIAIMTYSHPTDREILAYCLKQPHAYLGMIGSQRKVEMTKRMFREAGLGTAEELDAVDMPMGLPIGAEGPEEIAISILAKLLAVKNQVTAA